MSPTANKSLNPLPLKERMKVPRQLMPEQPADERNKNFSEVNLGYSPELARQEALRCLECAKPTCTDNCPVGVKVKEFVELIVAGDFLGAAAKIREDNVLPAVTGTSLSAGRSLRREVPAVEKSEAARHRLSGALCCRLRAAHGHPYSAQCNADGKESCGRRQRAFGADCGWGSHSEGPQGASVRGAARTGRSAGLWHS